MLAHGIRSYHRPATLEAAFHLVASGATPLSGGTRLLAAAFPVRDLVDLAALGRTEIGKRDGDLSLGASLSLQDVVDSPDAYAATGGLLPVACRTHTAPPALRRMATLAGAGLPG
jgi:CO/xanthine dehydrogenase FAD-binding subunit